MSDAKEKGGCGCGKEAKAQCSSKKKEYPEMKMSRRNFLKASVVAGSGAAALISAMSPLGMIKEYLSPEEFVQKHYKEMSKAEIDKVIARISAKVEDKYGVTPNLQDIKPMDGVEYMYALNLSRCNGSRRCVHACVDENNQSRSPEIQYISVL